MPVSKAVALRLRLGILMLASAAALALPAPSAARAAVKVLRYRGVTLRVPAAWPVFELNGRSGTCVRFDRHAVYLGSPAPDQVCPAEAAGRTEAILVAPLRASTARLLPAPTTAAARAGGGAARLVERGMAITATWSRDPAAVRRALGLRSLAAAQASLSARPAAAVIAHLRMRPQTAHASAAGVSLPGQIYTGLGFDACSAPSSGQMAAWGASPYRAIGVYIGGANMACAQGNLNATWTAQQAAAGWHLIPIYVGLQAPGNSCGCASITSSQASAQGTAAAQDAITQAQAIGLGPGNPIYFDMEAYPRGGSNTSAVLTFLSAWTSQLHAGGYRSGTYSSGASGVADLVSQYGTAYPEPDELWVADWNGQQTTSDPYIPASEWTAHQRLHQYDGAHNESYGGTTLNIDGDYLDAATAAPGTGSLVPAVAAAPSLGVSPAGDGSVNLYPTWSGEPGIASWQVLAGWSSGSLSPLVVRTGGRGPVVVRAGFTWYEANAFTSTGQELGSSGPVPVPWHAAIFGRSVFVSRGGMAGVPVGCFEPTPCAIGVRAWIGRRTLAVGGGTVPAGGGLVFMRLYPGARRILARARHNRLAAHIGVFGPGIRLSRVLNLIEFSTSGRRPYVRPARSPSVQSVGLTDFVFGGSSGGILADCTDTGPCLITLTVSAHGRTVGYSTPQWLGAGELGYVFFRLNATGRRMLAAVPGNQLGVRVRLSNTGASRSDPLARLALVAYR